MHRTILSQNNLSHMILFRTALIFSALFVCNSMLAQNQDKAVKAVINRFFEGMAKGDTALLKSACTDQPLLQTYMADEDGQLKVFTEEFGEFVRFVGAPRKDKYLEQIEFDAIQTEKSLASVWAPYKFYLNGKVVHCGTDAFQLVKTGEGWKIQYIIDTRRKDGCK